MITQHKKPKQDFKLVKSAFGKFEEIPKDWEIEVLGNLATLYVPMRDKPKKFDGNIPWLRIEDLDGKYVSESKTNQKVSLETVKKMKLRVNPVGTVLCSCSATIGVCAITKKELITNQTFIGIFPHSKLNNEFLYYFLNTQTFNLKKIGSGTTILYISRKKFEQFPIILPTIQEQQKIVLILSHVDLLDYQTQQIIKRIVSLRNGLMSQLLRKGINHTKFKKTNVGEIPQEWNIVQLKEIVLSYRNGIYKEENYYGKGPPCIRMFNIANGNISKDKAPLLTVTTKELEDYGLKPDDIVVNRVNSHYLVGKAGIVTKDLGPATFESKNIRIRINQEKINPQFLNYFLNTNNYLKQIRSFIKIAVAQVTINQTDLNEIKLPLPTISEQEKIVHILSGIENFLREEIKYKSQLEDLRKGLMQKLLTGKIRLI